MLAAWRADPGPWQPLGDERAIAGGVVQHFVHRMTAALATICSHPHAGTWWVTGPVRDKWYEAGAHLGQFAWPVGSPSATLDQRGVMQLFAAHPDALPGAIVSHPERGTFMVAPEIHSSWSSAGGERSLGLPDSDTRWSSDGQGRFSWYRGAVRQGIYWSKRHGTVLLPEAILSAWRWMGGEQAGLGYPVSGLRSPGQPDPSEVVFERGIIRADASGRLEIEATPGTPDGTAPTT